MPGRIMPLERFNPPNRSATGPDALAVAASQRRALNDLFSLTYEELRRLASAVKRGDPCSTLNPTALVNEAWL
jgi:hypothetical protein